MRSPEMSMRFSSEARKNDTQREVKFILRHTEADRPKLNDFADHKNGYTSNRIEKDQRYLAKLKERIAAGTDEIPSAMREKAREQKEYADALEATMINLGETSNWFGENSSVFRTTEYDDVVHGVDAVVEISIGDEEEISEEEVQRVALAIDASTAVEKPVLERKIVRNLQKICGLTEHGVEISYFKSEQTDYTGPLYDIIPVTIGIGKNNADELMSTYARILELKKIGTNKDESEKRELRSLLSKTAEHPAQMLFFKEMEIQLITYRNIVNSMGGVKHKSEILQQIDELASTIQELQKNKDEEGITIGRLENDVTYLAIIDICARLTPEKIEVKKEKPIEESTQEVQQ